MAIRLEGDTLSNPGQRPGYGLRYKACLEGSTLSAKAPRSRGTALQAELISR